MSLQTRVSSYLDRKQNAWHHAYWPIPFHHGTHQSKQEGTKYDHSRCHEFYENKKSVNIFPTVSKKTDSKIVQMNVLDLQLHSLWVRIVMV